MKPSLARSWPALLAMVALAAPAAAADRALGLKGANEIVVVAPQPTNWGTSTDSVVVVGPGNLHPPASNVVWELTVDPTSGVGVYQASAPVGDWWYQMDLPSGAILSRVEMEACDTSVGNEIRFGLATGTAPGGPATNLSSLVSTGGAAAPGCAFFPVTPIATTITNATDNYWIFFGWAGTSLTTTTTVHSFRIYYRLQVSPAPVVATFPNDVPTTHPFFRFIEAMAASGLTGGCAAGSYCPDSPVTRGQLAVFLASALGLHFPN